MPLFSQTNDFIASSSTAVKSLGKNFLWRNGVPLPNFSEPFNSTCSFVKFYRICVLLRLRLSFGVQFSTIIDIVSSGICSTWPYHLSSSICSTKSFSTFIISRIRSFLVRSNPDILADLRQNSISPLLAASFFVVNLVSTLQLHTGLYFV